MFSIIIITILFKYLFIQSLVDSSYVIIIYHKILILKCFPLHSIEKKKPIMRIIRAC